MTQYSVRMIFREALPDVIADRLASHEPSFRSVSRKAAAQRTEVVLDVSGDGVGEALLAAIATVSAVTSATVDSAEVLSNEEHLHRLGGPDALVRFERHMTDRL